MRGSAAFRTGVAPGGALAPGWVKNELWREARAVPSLDLRFADNKSLVDATTGASLVTFTRASSGTFVGSDGVLRTATTNEPRFDHNPTTGESLGLLVEEARTNVAWPSADYSGANWTKTNIQVSAATTTAPDGSTCFGYEGSSASSLLKRLRFNFTTTTVGTYTWSIYLKAGTEDSCAITIQDGTGVNVGYATILLTNGTVTGGPANSGANTGTTISVQAASNGFYRVSLTSTFVAALTQIQAIITWVINGSSTSTGTLFPWGAQLEQGSFATSVIPTTTAAATRSADVASITGSNFSSWYRQNSGSWYCSTNSLVFDSNERGLFGIDTGNFARGYATNTCSPTRIRARRRDATNTLAIDATSTSETRARVALVATSIEHATVYNGGAVRTDATALTLDPITDLRIGYQNITGIPANLYLCGCISRLTYFPTRLPNNTLQSITQ